MNKKSKEMTFEHLTKSEIYYILTERKKEAIRQYKFLFERHLNDDDSYKLNQQLFLNAKWFSDDIKKIDKLFEKYDLVDKECKSCGHVTNFTIDEIPF